MLVLDEKLIAWAALIGAALFVLYRGGRVERIGYLAIAANWLLTPLVEIRTSWMAPQFGIIGIDIALAVVLLALAVRTDRLWPIPAAAFECLGAFARVAALLSPSGLFRAAPYADAVVGYLVLGCVIGGAVVEAGARRPVRVTHSPTRGRSIKS